MTSPNATPKRTIRNVYSARPLPRRDLQRPYEARSKLEARLRRGTPDERKEFLAYYDWCKKEIEKVGAEMQELVDDCNGDLNSDAFLYYLTRKYCSNHIMAGWDPCSKSVREHFSNFELTEDERQAGVWKEKQSDILTTRRQSWTYPVMHGIQDGRVLSGVTLLIRQINQAGSFLHAAMPKNSTYVAGSGVNATSSDCPAGPDVPELFYTVMGYIQLGLTVALFVPYLMGHLPAQVRDGTRNMANMNRNRLAALACLPFAVNYMTQDEPTSRESSCFREGIRSWKQFSDPANRWDVRVKLAAMIREFSCFPLNLFCSSVSSVYLSGIFKASSTTVSGSWQIAGGVFAFGQGWLEVAQGVCEHLSAEAKVAAARKALLAAGSLHEIDKRKEEQACPALTAADLEFEKVPLQRTDTDQEYSKAPVDDDTATLNGEPSWDETSILVSVHDSDPESLSEYEAGDVGPGESAASLVATRASSDGKPHLYNASQIAHKKRVLNVQDKESWHGQVRAVKGGITVMISLFSMYFGAMQLAGVKSPPAALAVALLSTFTSSIYYLFAYRKMAMRSDEKLRLKQHHLDACYMRLKFSSAQLRESFGNRETIEIPDYENVLHPGWDLQPREVKLTGNPYLMLHIASEEVVALIHSYSDVKPAMSYGEVVEKLLDLPVFRWLIHTAKVKETVLGSLLRSTLGKASQFQYDYLKHGLAQALKLELFDSNDGLEKRPPAAMLVAAKLTQKLDSGEYLLPGRYGIDHNDKIKDGYIKRKAGLQFQAAFASAAAGRVWLKKESYDALTRGGISDEEFIAAVNEVASRYKPPKKWRPEHFRFAQLVEIARYAENFRLAGLAGVASPGFHAYLAEKYSNEIKRMPDGSLHAFSEKVKDYARVPIAKRGEQVAKLRKLSEDRVMIMLCESWERLKGKDEVKGKGKQITAVDYLYDNGVTLLIDRVENDTAVHFKESTARDSPVRKRSDVVTRVPTEVGDGDDAYESETETHDNSDDNDADNVSGRGNSSSYPNDSSDSSDSSSTQSFVVRQKSTRKVPGDGSSYASVSGRSQGNAAGSPTAPKPASTPSILDMETDSE